MPKSRFEHLGLAADIRTEGAITEVPAVGEPQPPEEEIVQLNLKVPDSLRTALRMRALKLGMPLTEALRPLLQAWAAED